MKIPVVSLIFTFILGGCTPQLSSFLKNNTLKNVSSDKNTGAQVIENKLVVLVFFATDCPICQKYVPILRGMAESFSDIKFILVFSKWETKEAIKTFALDFNMEDTPSNQPNHNITLLQDTHNQLIKKLKATTTPEAFFYSKNHRLLYRGAIDNWFYALGRYRPQATEYYLQNAINQYLNNDKITISNTKAVGCFIEY